MQTRLTICGCPPQLLQASIVKTLQLQAERLGLSTDMLFAWKAYLTKLYGSLVPSLEPSDQSGDWNPTPSELYLIITLFLL